MTDFAYSTEEGKNENYFRRYLLMSLGVGCGKLGGGPENGAGVALGGSFVGLLTLEPMGLVVGSFMGHFRP